MEKGRTGVAEDVSEIGYKNKNNFQFNSYRRKKIVRAI